MAYFEHLHTLECAKYLLTDQYSFRWGNNKAKVNHYDVFATMYIFSIAYKNIRMSSILLSTLMTIQNDICKFDRTREKISITI